MSNEFDNFEKEIKIMKLESLKQQLSNSYLTPGQKYKLIKQAQMDLDIQVEAVRPKILNNEINDVIFLNINPNSFSKAAYPDLSLQKLSQILVEQDYVFSQIEIPKESFPAEYTEEEIKAKQIQLNKFRQELIENHYSMVYLSLCFYSILDQFSINSDFIQFVIMKNKVASLLIDYNSEFNLRKEWMGISSIYNITDIISEFKTFLSSEEYKKVKLEKLLIQGNQYASSFMVFTNKFNKNSNNDSKSVNMVRVSDIDFSSAGTTIEQQVDKITQLFDIVRQDSITIFSKIKDIGYDIFSGKINAELTNSQIIRLIQQTKFLKDYYQKSKMLESRPYFYLINTYKLYIFHEKYSMRNSLGETYGHFSITPGETRSLTIKTAEISKKNRLEQSTIFDSNSIEAQEDFDKSLENQNDQSSSYNKDFNAYLDTQSYVRGDTTVGVKLFGNGTNVNVQAGIDVQGGLSTSINNSRKESAKSIEKTAEKHATKQTGKRDVTVSDQTQSSSETTKEETSVIHIANPNKYSNLNILFRQLVEDYLNFVVLDDIYIAFHNGFTYEKVHISNANLLLDRYIQYPEARENIRKIIIEAGIVLDYQSRNLKYISETLQINKSKSFFEMLEENKYTPNTTDLGFEEYLQVIRGIPLDYQRISIPKNILVAQCIPDNIALNELEESFVKVELKTLNTDIEAKEVNISSAKATVDAKKVMVEHLRNMQPIEAARAFFIDFNDGKMIYDKTTALNLVGHVFKDNEI